LPRCHRPSPSEEWVGFPRFVPRITTSRRPVFRGCRYSLMFRPPSLLSPQIVPPAAILPQGSRGFYVRAYRALLPPHAPDMLTVRVQVIDGTGTLTLSDSQPCRLLTSLDGVAFIDPRSSEIDIIQSVGRAIRLSENKTMGTVVIPVFIGQTDNAEEALEASEFKPIWDVLEALKSHDERLSDELDQLRIELGAKRRRSVGISDLTKIVFDLPTSVSESFAQSLRVHLVEQTTESWM